MVLSTGPPDFIVTKRATEPEYLSQAVIDAVKQIQPPPQDFTNYPPNNVWKSTGWMSDGQNLTGF